MLYDGGKIITGVVIFLILITFPFWANLGKAAYQRPELEKPAQAKECVEEADWMRGNHMQLLDEWRDHAVRGDGRVYVSKSGRQFNMSLSNTCLDCHASKANFCDRCHDATAVKPYCWDCHIEDPKGKS